MLSVTWIKSTSDTWLPLETVLLQNVDAAGVYVIWHAGQPSRVVRVGQASDIAKRLGEHRRDPEILKYRAHGILRVTWAYVPVAQRDGVERYLANEYSPLVGDAFPNVVPIPVNLAA
jgi:hypothetical protein